MTGCSLKTSCSNSATTVMVLGGGPLGGDLSPRLHPHEQLVPSPQEWDSYSWGGFGIKVLSPMLSVLRGHRGKALTGCPLVLHFPVHLCKKYSFVKINSDFHASQTNLLKCHKIHLYIFYHFLFHSRPICSSSILEHWSSSSSFVGETLCLQNSAFSSFLQRELQAEFEDLTLCLWSLWVVRHIWCPKQFFSHHGAQPWYNHSILQTKTVLLSFC